MFRKCLIAIAALMVLLTSSYAENAPGVTPGEIKIGSIFPFSGPASSFGNAGKGLIAYVNFINERGGVNNRKINLIALDDSYSPPKAVEHTRRLVESDEVAFMFSTLGTASNSAIVKYLTSKKIPHLFILTGAAKFTDAKEYPYTTTSLASYETEARVYAKYISKMHPNDKIAILYQNDDLGKDFVAGFRAALGAKFDQKVVLSAYEVSQPTIESQVVSLKSSGAGVYVFAGAQKFAAQSIRKTFEMDWKPVQIVNAVSTSVATVLQPAGLDKAVGVITGTYRKDPDDPLWQNDPGVKRYREFIAKYLPGTDYNDNNYVAGMHQGIILEQLLKQCGEDLSRENLNRQAHNIKLPTMPMSLPGVEINTSSTNNQAYTQYQLQRWNGQTWDRFGDILDGFEGQ